MALGGALLGAAAREALGVLQKPSIAHLKWMIWGGYEARYFCGRYCEVCRQLGALTLRNISQHVRMSYKAAC